MKEGIVFSFLSSTLHTILDTCRKANTIFSGRLGLELTKIMVLQYSNQETSVTIGESVRDEDGTVAPSVYLCFFVLLPTSRARPRLLHGATYLLSLMSRCAYYMSAVPQSLFFNLHDPTISTMA